MGWCGKRGARSDWEVNIGRWGRWKVDFELRAGSDVDIRYEIRRNFCIIYSLLISTDFWSRRFLMNCIFSIHFYIKSMDFHESIC